MLVSLVQQKSRSILQTLPYLTYAMEPCKSVDNALKSIQHIQHFKTLKFTNLETAYQKVFKT